MSAWILGIELERGDRAFRAGELVRGRIVGRSGRTDNFRKLGLRWRCQVGAGQGTMDFDPKKTVLVESILVDDPPLPDSPLLVPFEFEAPAEPLSYEGKQVRVTHGLEVFVDLAGALDPKAEEEVRLLPGHTSSPSVRIHRGQVQTADRPKSHLWLRLFGGIALVGTAVMMPFLGEAVAGAVALVGLWFIWEGSGALRGRHKLGSVMIQLDSSLVSPGELIPIKVTCRPERHLNAVGVRVRLRGTEKRDVPSGNRTRTVEHILHEETFDLDGPSTIDPTMQAEWSGALQVPHTDAWTMGSVLGRFRIEWGLTATVKSDGARSEITELVHLVPRLARRGLATRLTPQLRYLAERFVVLDSDETCGAENASVVSAAEQALKREGEWEKYLEQVLEREYSIILEISRTELTEGETEDSRYDGGRAVVGVVQGAGIPVEVLFHSSWNDDVDALESGQRLRLTVELAAIQPEAFGIGSSTEEAPPAAETPRPPSQVTAGVPSQAAFQQSPSKWNDTLALKPKSQWTKRALYGALLVVGGAVALTLPWVVGSTSSPVTAVTAPTTTYTVASRTVSLAGGDRPIVVAVVDPKFFLAASMTEPHLGRAFLPADFASSEGGIATNSRSAVLLTHGFWENHFDSDPDVLGRSLLIGGAPHLIVGVGAPGLGGPQGAEIFLPHAEESASGATLSNEAPANSGSVADHSPLEEIGICYSADRMVTPEGFVFSDLVLSEARVRPFVHLARFRPALDTSQGDDGAADRYLIVREAAGVPCLAHWVGLPMEGPGMLEAVGVATGDVVVLNYRHERATDGPPTGYGLLVGPTGESTPLNSGGLVDLMPGGDLLLGSTGMLDLTGQVMRFADLGDYPVLRAYPVNASTTLVIRCAPDVCGHDFRLDDARGSAQLIEWDRGVIEEFPFAGLIQSAIADVTIVSVDTRWSEQRIALFDHTSNTLTLLLRDAPNQRSTYPLTDLRQVTEEPEDSLSKVYFEVFNAVTFGSESFEFYFTTETEAPSYRRQSS